MPDQGSCALVLLHTPRARTIFNLSSVCDYVIDFRSAVCTVYSTQINYLAFFFDPISPNNLTAFPGPSNLSTFSNGL